MSSTKVVDAFEFHFVKFKEEGILYFLQSGI